MTNTVIHLTHCVDKLLIIRLFSKFRSRYGQLWTSRAKTDEEWEFIIEDWLEELIQFDFENLRLAVNKALAIYKDYPPTLSQLSDLCFKESGLPAVHDIARSLVNREFTHPLVKMVYEKIGSWTLSNAKEHEINLKVQESYNYCLAEFKNDPTYYWEKLNSYNNQIKLQSPESVPNIVENISISERMQQYKKFAEETKSKIKSKSHPEFDKDKINPNHRDFDNKIFQEYRNYHLSIPETEVLTLSPRNAYQRMRLLAAKDALNSVSSPIPQDINNYSSTGFNGANKGYKNWNE